MSDQERTAKRQKVKKEKEEEKEEIYEEDSDDDDDEQEDVVELDFGGEEPSGSEILQLALDELNSGSLNVVVKLFETAIANFEKEEQNEESKEPTWQYNFGVALLEFGRLQQFSEYLEKSKGIFEKLMKADSSNHNSTLKYARSCVELATVLRRKELEKHSQLEEEEEEEEEQEEGEESKEPTEKENSLIDSAISVCNSTIAKLKEEKEKFIAIIEFLNTLKDYVSTIDGKRRAQLLDIAFDILDKIPSTADENRKSTQNYTNGVLLALRGAMQCFENEAIAALETLKKAIAKLEQCEAIDKNEWLAQCLLSLTTVDEMENAENHIKRASELMKQYYEEHPDRVKITLLEQLEEMGSLLEMDPEGYEDEENE